ncbi:hypothetical protein [Mycobacteroides abscessus]|uniref:hypothetical protein n=1 Tax=Mycobacteroides abscessus TaxID=36809 RepID=UPI0009A59867|nr:hypothetical protein [Mycobacteroides abscessus]SLF09229.1 Uncharacterised protein [Mycobacteroides abscessus subsp. massiliense]SLJ13404.1 Uncharacterised protein [Mycobacteroides abscessus subsp. abscessus]
MKLLVIAAATTLALLAAPVVSADPQQPWCEWSPDVDMNACGLIIGVPPQGQLVPSTGDWTTGETRTK